MIDMAATAMITANIARASAIGDNQFAPAMPTTQETREQTRAAANRAATGGTPAVGVIADQALIPFELRLVDISRVVVEKQSFPFVRRLLEAPRNPLAAILDRDPRPRSSKGVNAGVDRVGQDMMQGIVDWRFPDDLPTFGAVGHGRQQKLFLSQPQMNLADALEFDELGEHERDGFLNAPIRILLDSFLGGSDVSDRHRHESSPRRAFWRNASTDRCRNSDSSISLIVPFMPSKSLSFGDVAS